MFLNFWKNFMHITKNAPLLQHTVHIFVCIVNTILPKLEDGGRRTNYFAFLGYLPLDFINLKLLTLMQLFTRRNLIGLFLA